MGLIAVAAARGGVRWTDGHSAGTAGSLGELMGKLDRPHAVICEPGSYDGLRDVRRALEDLLAERGHRLLPITESVRVTLERACGATCTGRSVTRLFTLTTVGARGISRTVAIHDLSQLRAALQVAHVVDLYDDRPQPLLEALDAVWPYGTLDDATRASLGDGRTYRLDVLLAAYRVASVATSRDAFDRLLGLTAAAHGSLTETIRAWYVEKNSSEGFVRESALSWSDYRRALRRVFHRVKEHRAGP